MPVRIRTPSGQPAVGVTVEVASTIYANVKSVGTTDASGIVGFGNIALTTISIVARSATNEIAVTGIAATPSTLTLTLLAFLPPSPIDNNDFLFGSDGWVASNNDSISIIPHANTKRALGDDLEISTNGLEGLQMVSRTYAVESNTTSVSIRYKFITSEIPGGFFGSQFNDYFSITIRSDAGDYVDYTNSMNNLGLGAFDASGATDWFTLKLDIQPEAQTVQFDIGVSNVADAELQSAVVVDKIENDGCDKCDDCETCPSNPKCEADCQDPPEQSCAFYRKCVEGHLRCETDPLGYALQYGERKCHDFTAVINQFTPEGQAWLWKTMSCLQHALVPALTCEATCASLRQTAFESHAGCYVNSGLCELSLLTSNDGILLLFAIGEDLWTLESLKQIEETAAGCLDVWVGKIVDDIVEIGVGIVGTAEEIWMKALEVGQEFLQNIGEAIDSIGQ
ncbi:hypothetical protein ABW19_dt0201234 [Dactylella cylindrospora]|nr:hypothetical protein ABW19_dt0201234 [Dactylella cylindrospora]